MNLRDTLRRMTGPDPRIDELSSGLTEALDGLKAAKAEIGRLEGLLDVVNDPDSQTIGAGNASLFREIWGGHTASRDFDENQRRKILGLSHLVYALRGEAENLIDTQLDFILGDELMPVSQHEALLKRLKEVWEDERNCLGEKHEAHTLAWMLDGELHLRAYVSAEDGHVELGWLDPLAVNRVVQDRRGRDAFLHVAPEKPGGANQVLFCLQSLNERVTLEPLAAGRWRIEDEAGQARTVDGLAYSGFWARPPGATRGRPDLSQVIDEIDASNELVWSTVEVQNLRRWFLLWVKDPSIRTKAEATETLRKLNLVSPPRNPRSIATNSQVEIDLLANQQTGAGDEWLARELSAKIGGAKGLPGAWFGRHADQRESGARASDLVPLRRLRRKQRRVTRFWHGVVASMLDVQARVTGDQVPEGTWEMQALEVGGRDRQRGAEIIKAIAAAAVQAQSSGTAKRELLHAVLVQSFREAGFEVQREHEGVPEDELEQQVAGARAMVNQLVTRKSRTGEGGQDEEDRDRVRERTDAA
ncbi:MAG TPA: hypothetical protein VD788_13320 [Candidatus Polarisedimenticolaceae bacterium]|nr:hypothetical protein [Candidatus Polarisedimenticolaceae bacterium]